MIGGGFAQARPQGGFGRRRGWGNAQHGSLGGAGRAAAQRTERGLPAPAMTPPRLLRRRPLPVVTSSAHAPTRASQ